MTVVVRRDHVRCRDHVRFRFRDLVGVHVHVRGHLVLLVPFAVVELDHEKTFEPLNRKWATVELAVLEAGQAASEAGHAAQERVGVHRHRDHRHLSEE